MIKECRACYSDRLIEFLDLGEQYLSDFRKDYSKPPKYPLVAVMCESCKLVQLKHTVLQKEMYHENYGFKSGISDSVKEDLDSIVTHAFQYQPNPKHWLDIACNDGTLLSFVPRDIYRVGVDPVSFLCKEAEAHADKIVNDYFNPDLLTYTDYDTNGAFKKQETFDVITSISCFYDMPDPAKFVRDVKSVLAEKGVWIIQQNYLLTTLELGAIDNFVHEHLEYYTLLSLENLLKRFDLEVNEVTTSMVNGGSIRTVVSRKGTYPIDESVWGQRNLEDDFGIDNISAYKNFADKAGEQIESLSRTVKYLKGDGKSIAILAASTRGATIWQSAGIDSGLVDYAVERNPAKVGKVFSALGIPIISEKEARKLNPDYMLVGPWFFKSEILEREKQYLKNGGKLILPLPKVKIYEASDMVAHV